MERRKSKWASVKAHHVSQACDALMRSGVSPKPHGLVVMYKNHKLPVKAVLKLAYCIANDIPTETPIKFSSGEKSLTLLRSLGFSAERLQGTTVVQP
jgi:hypothetical protein